MQPLIATVACYKCKSPLNPPQSTCPYCGSSQQGRSGYPSVRSFLLWAFSIALLLPACVAIAGASYLHFRLVRSEAYQESVKTALSSSEVQNLLGDGISVRQPPLGYLIPIGEAQFAQWSVALTGSQGSGHLYGVATQVKGIWDVSRLAFRSESNGKRVDLTPVHPLRLPVVPAKSVYLVPIGLVGDESVAWAPAYYKSRLGIDLTLLPSVPLTPNLFDSKRHQLNSDQCIEALTKEYPEVARDPFSILIGVTSSDMYIPDFNWSYAENMRQDGRYAIISTARLHPPSLLEKWNPEWLTARTQKLLTKNLAILYFDLPMSSDYTSVLSGGVLSGLEIDEIGGDVIGAEREWDPFVEQGEPSTTIYDGPGDNLLWRLSSMRSAVPETSSQVFSMDLGVGLIVQRKADFVFEDEPAMQFTRVYRNQDDRSRAFGVGGSDSFEIFLGGQMGVAVDLIMEDGYRVHFKHAKPEAGQRGDTYLPSWGAEGRFAGAQAVYSAGTWKVTTKEGWIYIFPYRPQALPQNVTVLTGFIDPSGHRYEMKRDSFGALSEVNSPSGNWLRFENDPQHRIWKITSSQGRIMRYEYDAVGGMVRATDSEGRVDSYTYDGKGQMLTASHGSEKPVLMNDYFIDGYIKNQTLRDGGKFAYAYFKRDRGVIYENQITDPRGLQTYIQYVRGGYVRSLPAPIPH